MLAQYTIGFDKKIGTFCLTKTVPSHLKRYFITASKAMSAEIAPQYLEVVDLTLFSIFKG